MKTDTENPPVLSALTTTRGDIFRGSMRSGRVGGPVRSFLLLVGVFVVFTIVTSSFSSAGNVSSLLSFAAPAVLVAVGQTFVISLGEIDLSVASVAALSGIVLISSEPLGLPLAFVLAIGTGLIAGLFNGIVTAMLRVPSLVSSLAMLFIAQGLAYVLASKPISGARLDATIFFQHPLGPILSVQSLFVLVIVVIAAVILGLTPLGRALYARGSNPRGVRSIGLPSRALVIGSMAASGALAAFAGCIIAIGLNSASPVVGSDLLLLGIAGCLIGGSKLEGGSGSIVGSSLALVALLALENGMDQLGVSAYVQQVVQGTVVLVALLASTTGTVGGLDLSAFKSRMTSQRRKEFAQLPRQ